MKLSRIFPLLVASLALGGAVYTVNSQKYDAAQASEEIHIESPSDSFSLLDKQYAENESFVYTGDLHFTSGQAGGLAFGAVENDHYFVVNMDRYEIHVKLMYFKCNGSGGFEYVKEIRVADFIGNSSIEHGEWELINPKVGECPQDVQDKHYYRKHGANAYYGQGGK